MNCIKDFYFCAAKIRPNCIRNTDKKMQNLCCIHCDKIDLCKEHNTKINPCDPNDINIEEECPFSL